MLGELSTSKEEAMETRTASYPQLELYVGKDILQGEKVPFYMIWKKADISRVTFRYFGFKKIVKLYNVRSFERTDNGAVVTTDQVKVEGYIGGVLSTALGKLAQEEATLHVKLEFSDGTVKDLLESRMLYSARAELSRKADRVTLPLRN